PREALPSRGSLLAHVAVPPSRPAHNEQDSAAWARQAKRRPDPALVRTAICFEPRGGVLHVFLPPVGELEDYLELIAVIEGVAGQRGRKPVAEGYPPPRDPRLKQFSVTPDPGVIEVNIHPAASWDELVEHTSGLYEDARQTRLGTEKFMV